MTIAALFVRANSHYKALGLDCYDFERDALTWPGGSPGIFHPPCRSWGRYHHVAKPRAGEKDLARWAMTNVRRFGGVVEHPITSRLWKESFCLSFGVRDDFGGVLLPLNQSWFGHLAPKPTALYIVGCAVPDLAQHYSEELAVGRIENMSTAQRETTPLPFARFLVDLVNTCKAVS